MKFKAQMVVMYNGLSEVIIACSFRGVRVFRYVTVIYGNNELYFIIKDVC